MRLMKRMAAIVLAGALALFGVNAAQAAEDLPQSDREAIAQELRVLGVPQDKVSSLVDSFARGELWDSLKPDAVPTVTEEHDIDGEHFVVDRFADGSVSVTSISRPDDGPGVDRAVSGCKVTKRGGTRVFTGCHASVNKVVVSLAFDFDYVKPAGRAASITACRNPTYHFVIGTLGNVKLNKTTSKTARLSAVFNFAFKGFPAGTTVWVQANVSGLRAWTTHWIFGV